MVKRILKFIIGKGRYSSIRRFLSIFKTRNKLFENFKYDFERFDQYADPKRNLQTFEGSIAYIIMLYHALEKGFSLPSPRAGFGKEKALLLLNAMDKHLEKFKPSLQFYSALKVLECYLSYLKELDFDFDGIERKLKTLKNKVEEKNLAQGGFKKTSREIIQSNSQIDLSKFFESRHSIRNFSAVEVERALLYQAIKMAQKSPSVCNRQSARVYIYNNDARGKAILNCQNGNKGFGHTANKILIITSELGAFLSVGERNQCWIDGGLFAMSIIYALHSLGLGTCCLNWSMEKEDDLKLRKEANISESENVIMLIAVGHIPDTLNIAISSRYETNSIVNDFTI
jgi:nitroreductase